MNSSSLPPVFLRAIAQLGAEPDRYPDLRGVTIEPVRFEDREAAQVLRARVRSAQGADRHIFVKVFKPRSASADDRAAARARVTRDFATTSEVHAAFRGHARFGAVRPIACFPDDLVLVTDEAPGEPLDGLLERRAAWQLGAGSIEDLAEAARGVGAWLKAFQAIRPVGRRITVDSLREYLDVRLRRLAASPKAAFSARDRGAVLAYFDAMSRELTPADLVEVVVHADIAPSNVLVNGHAIVVIDFAMAGTGGLYLDVARLFTQLDFLKAKPKFRPHVVARLQAALLEGFDPALRASHPLFQLYELQHVVCHVANLSLNPAPPVARLYNLYQLQRHRRWLRDRAA